MKDQLISYVNLLFAGNTDCEDIRQEILQNTLDRYDDLIADGKSPEAAYRLAIGGIGDINELLGASRQSGEPPKAAGRNDPGKKGLRAIAVALYILCPLPLLVAADTGREIYGLCGLLAMVAIATALRMLGAPDKAGEPPAQARELTPRQQLWWGLRRLIRLAMLVAYFLISFKTRAWHITWLLLPVCCALEELVKAIWDLKECAK